ncbi:NAD(P)H-dependent FMN reductase [Chitiniphilus shinanonensis]|uniref:NAD(P)H-dependent FMN reductase n=1 Tax=Chitiniphilus shinanonensis TaxID=553088 RepID=A0ABQ6BTW8_9NEIS|nr:NADPH-dependent FMN reductase [Chitiniphilus shinanonensis]GLS04772.1 NAD(P)H-dependent FMN reductase [Chitiniphilus shinanonensis]
MPSSVRVLAFCGSLRQGSYNAAALEAAIELAPAGMTIERAEIGDFPLFNQDVQAAGFPPAVERVAAQVRAADAVLIATPEYNYSVPGVLKNALDWLSRLPDAPLGGKPAAIFGASPGVIGTARAQYHLRQIGVSLNLRLLNKPEVMIGQAGQRFENGRLTDVPTREHLQKLLVALGDLAAAG